MNVKIDTKEKFTVITPKESNLSANMSADLKKLVLPYLDSNPPHVVLNLSEVIAIDKQNCLALGNLHEQFYSKNCSFVICNLNKEVEKSFKDVDLFESLNVTPTESEAWDMVQMEEIERELLNGL